MIPFCNTFLVYTWVSLYLGWVIKDYHNNINIIHKFPVILIDAENFNSKKWIKFSELVIADTFFMSTF